MPTDHLAVSIVPGKLPVGRPGQTGREKAIPIVPGKRPVGRPRKTDEGKAQAKALKAGKRRSTTAREDIDEGIQLFPSPKRKRGRPRKSDTVTISPLQDDEVEPEVLAVAGRSPVNGVGELLQSFAGQPINGPRVLRLKRSQLKNPDSTGESTEQNVGNELVDEDDWGPYHLRDR